MTTANFPPLRPPLTDEQWAKIKESLGHVSVDADTVAVEARNKQGPLREMLPRIAQGCDLEVYLRRKKSFLTPTVLAERQEGTIELCKELLARLADGNHVDYDNFPDEIAARRLRRRHQPSSCVACLPGCFGWRWRGPPN
jgi:hypothetical protein